MRPNELPMTAITKQSALRKALALNKVVNLAPIVAKNAHSIERFRARTRGGPSMNRAFRPGSTDATVDAKIPLRPVQRAHRLASDARDQRESGSVVAKE